jgi:lipopolysaccharide/colanic/teichoic acid biosynthesis glycosyltransferase
VNREAPISARRRSAGRGDRQASLLHRKRFQLALSLLLAALLPWAARAFLQGYMFEPASINGLIGNVVAIAIAFWMRLSIETYPGIRRSFVLLPAALTGHGLVVTWFLLTRFPYDRLALLAGFVINVVALYAIYVYANRNVRRRFAVVPYGALGSLEKIESVDWLRLKRPSLADARNADAIVADFSADLPDEWEAFLADAALAGRIVYQVKQLSESLTGRVELEHLSENSFGSLVPVRGYFYLKGFADFLLAVLMLPFVIIPMAVIAILIRLDSPGPAFFRQRRVGQAGRPITVFKFRTMRMIIAEDERLAAMTGADDDRVTRLGKVLRKTRIDELPQIINILLWQMSWIGPRPEAAILSKWYTSEIPFYRYRHVVKPGISGWAQVNQGHVAEVDEVHRKLQYDFYYIKYFSPWLDVLILFRTIKTMLSGFGAR